jgi:hypothetical protein
MWSAFPTSDYYGSSAPPRPHRPTTGLPTAPHAAARVGTAGMVPTFTVDPIDGVGAQLCPCSIATATPQAFTMASSPLELNGFGVHPVKSDEVVRCAPAHIHQVGAGFAVTKRQSLVHSRYTFWPRLDEPAPSGSPSTSRLRQGRLPPSPPLHGSGCPQASTGPLRRPGGKVSHPPRSISATWRTAPRRNSCWPHAGSR